MSAILPIQGTFDKAIPDNFGNAEYRAERQLLLTIDAIIGQCSLENSVIEYFMDAASVNKYIAVFGTHKSARLTSDERDHVRADAVLAFRMSILRKRLTLLSADRGFDSDDNRKYMESNDIFNAVCPRNPDQLRQRLDEGIFNDAQRRRSQTEARISILSHGFCGNPMKQKGFDHRYCHMGLSVLSHNLWVLGRLKIKQQQEKEKQQAA